MDKKTLTGLLLLVSLALFYPLLLKQFYPDYYKSLASSSEAKKAAASAASETSPSSGAATAIGAPPAEALSPEDDQVFQSKKLYLVFNRKGGGIRQISFPAFNDSETKKPLELLSLKDSKGMPTAIQFLEPSSVDPIRHDIQIAGPSVILNGNLSPLKIKKEYFFAPDGYSAKLIVTLENSSSVSADARYQIHAGARIPPRHSIDGQYISANFFSQANGKKNIRHMGAPALGKQVTSAGPVEWVAIKDRHFSVILKPASGTEAYTGLVQGLEHKQMSVSLVSPKFTLPPRGSLKQEFLLYIGPNELDILEPLGLGELVNFGKLDWIGKLLVGGLEMLHKIFHNYGTAIIVLTIMINILLFPLTRASYMSMKRMQLIQPQMNKLREHHKKSPEKLNKEMMELYKKHKVNPFGGCLPMLLQMPVFIALYVALSKSAILINSSWFWIKDLSSPDSVALPFSLPVLGNQIHLLPLIMVAGMFFQQKFTQIKMDGQDPAMAAQQKMMGIMMPIFMGFIFYTMPSGLVLYWLTNTVLMTSYQFYLKRVTLT